jgi:hypothetical protein
VKADFRYALTHVWHRPEIARGFATLNQATGSLRRNEHPLALHVTWLGCHPAKRLALGSTSQNYTRLDIFTGS